MPVYFSSRAVRLATFGVALAAVVALSACSDDALMDLGGRSGGWIGEVATTVTTTTTTTPVTIQPAAEAEWVNDDLGPDPGAEPDIVLSAVFGRSEGTSSFLQASRAEIVALLPDVGFPGVIPAEAGYITSQLVIESQALRLATDPTVAFGMWSVVPYSRSRTLGQVAVLNVATDPVGAAAATNAEEEPTCDRYLETPELECAIEWLEDAVVWRLESAEGITHVWYDAQFRYELSARPDVPEEFTHTMVTTLTPLSDITPP
ncbi:hypothetical protein BH23ACT5_BH23ACT5_22730 [soil metagenome]